MKVTDLQSKLTKSLIAFAILIFGLAATGKLSSNFRDPRLLTPDPFISFMSMGTLLLIVGVLEILVVALLIRAYMVNPARGIPVVFWICAVLFAYRLGHWFSPQLPGVCHCFGVGSVFGKWGSKLDQLSFLFVSVMGLASGTLLLLGLRHSTTKAVKTLAVLLAFCACSAPLGFSSPAFEPAYTVEGTVEEHFLNETHQMLTTNVYPFKLSADTLGRWKMEWTMRFPRWDMTSVEHLAFDGTNIFSVNYSDKRLGKDMQPENNLPLEQHEHPGRVCRGPFPTDYSSVIGLLWIAYCGGGHVAQTGAPQIPDLLVSMARTDPIAWSTDCHYTLASDSPNPLIASAEFVLNRHKVGTKLIDYPEVDEPEDTAKIEGYLTMLEHLKKAKDEDLLRASYQIRKSAMAGGLKIPTEFTALEYTPPDSRRGRFAMIEWTGTVTNILTAHSSTSMLPEVLGKINVQDRRFKARTQTQFLNNIWYLLDSDGWIESTNDQRFKTKIPVPVLSRQSILVHKSGRALSLILIAVVLTLPLPFFLWKKRIPQTQ